MIFSNPVPFTVHTSFTRKSGAFAVTYTSTQLNMCLLTISSEIESSVCFAKKLTIFYYIVNNSTVRASLIVNNSTMA